MKQERLKWLNFSWRWSGRRNANRSKGKICKLGNIFFLFDNNKKWLTKTNVLCTLFVEESSHITFDTSCFKCNCSLEGFIGLDPANFSGTLKISATFMATDSPLSYYLYTTFTELVNYWVSELSFCLSTLT